MRPLLMRVTSARQLPCAEDEAEKGARGQKGTLAERCLQRAKDLRQQIVTLLRRGLEVEGSFGQGHIPGL